MAGSRSLQRELKCSSSDLVSAKNKHGVCAYCGRNRKLTKDHVPPKLLLEHPYPPNLWTVPACYDCNGSFKADDEYTQAVLTGDLRATWNSAAQSNLRRVVRSLESPAARGFLKYLASQTTSARIVTPSGSPVMVTEVDRTRANKTGMRLMRGLYFREAGKRVPRDAVVRMESRAGLTADHPDMLTIARMFSIFPDHRNGAKGTAFSYFAAFGGNMSFWLMLLYDFFFWFGYVDERAKEERDREV
jgi:hypothetical protein